MISFKLLKKSSRSQARAGVISTPHGEILTPALITVATQAVVKTLDNSEVGEVGSQALIANAYHLNIKPGGKIVKKAGGLHQFMNWQRPLMTDSGGFQVFSLGFGKDFGTGKILKQALNLTIEKGQQPKLLKISEDGVTFRSYVDGRKLFIGPKESIKIQEDLGADIIFVFDECTSPIADYEYTKKSLERTNRWAKTCQASQKSKQALFGIVQGGKFKDLRIASASAVDRMDFIGYSIGGEFGDNKKSMLEMLEVVNQNLNERKPRHLLGIGYLEDIENIVKSGVDTFDCIVPTHYARHGKAFTSVGQIDLKGKNPDYITDRTPLDPKCDCSVCQSYTKSYLTHLLRAYEITPLKLITYHNLYFFNRYIRALRKKILDGKL